MKHRKIRDEERKLILAFDKALSAIFQLGYALNDIEKGTRKFIREVKKNEKRK